MEGLGRAELWPVPNNAGWLVAAGHCTSASAPPSGSSAEERASIHCCQATDSEQKVFINKINVKKCKKEKYVNLRFLIS